VPVSVVIDRCNPEPLQRKAWIEDVRKAGVWNIVAIYLDIDRREAKSRVMERKNHPTLPAAEKSKEVIDEFADSLHKPTLTEGFLEVVTIRTDKEFKLAVDRFSRMLP